jgi:hypothetical protein
MKTVLQGPNHPVFKGSESPARKSSKQQSARKIKWVEITTEQYTVARNHCTSSDILRAGCCSPILRAADLVPCLSPYLGIAQLGEQHKDLKVACPIHAHRITVLNKSFWSESDPFLPLSDGLDNCALLIRADLSRLCWIKRPKTG